MWKYSFKCFIFSTKKFSHLTLYGRYDIEYDDTIVTEAIILFLYRFLGSKLVGDRVPRGEGISENCIEFFGILIKKYSCIFMMDREIRMILKCEIFFRKIGHSRVDLYDIERIVWIFCEIIFRKRISSTSEHKSR